MNLVSITNVFADIVVIIGGAYVMYKAHQLVNEMKLIRKKLEKTDSNEKEIKLITEIGNNN